MKRLIYTAIIASIIPTTLFADTEYRASPLPGAKSEVSISSSNALLPEAMRKEQEAFLHQQKTKGYSDLESEYPKILLSLGKNGPASFEKKNGIKGDSSETHMKSTISEVKVAFDFKEVPSVDKNNVIGFSPRGMFVNSKWTGATEFFNDKNIGTCKYSATNMKLSNGSAKIDSAAVRYDINQKPGDIFVQGSLNSGFIYSVLWFHKEYSYALECANMNYDKKITNKAIELAQAIDKNNG